LSPAQAPDEDGDIEVRAKMSSFLVDPAPVEGAEVMLGVTRRQPFRACLGSKAVEGGGVSTMILRRIAGSLTQSPKA